MGAAQEPKIKADMHMVAAYHEYFLFGHFDWLQKGDPRIGNKPGFLSAHIGSRYFLMYQDLRKCCNDGWRELPKFDQFRQSLQELSAESRYFHAENCNAFVAKALECLETHFGIWVRDNLHLSLFAEPQIAKVVVQFLVGRPHDIVEENFVSAIHKQDVNIKEFREFLEKKACRDNQLTCCYTVSRFWDQIMDMATEQQPHRHGMWSPDCSHDMKDFKDFYLETFAALP